MNNEQLVEKVLPFHLVSNYEFEETEIRNAEVANSRSNLEKAIKDGLLVSGEEATLKAKIAYRQGWTDGFDDADREVRLPTKEELMEFVSEEASEEIINFLKNGR